MKTKITALLIVFLAVFYSCESELDKYYETPGWLKGNAWQVLESEGNFKLFLAAVDRTTNDLKYKDLVQGKGIITVMAPTDEAFQAYLTKNGYSSVNDIPVDVINKLVGYHLLYYSFNADAFKDYKPDGISSVNKYPGMYYKYRTKSTDGVVQIQDPTIDTTIVMVNVVQKERFLPIFSFNYFNSYELNAKSDYEYFYPNSTWTGAENFNVSNASLIPTKDNKLALVTDNGYVYMIDQVLDPLETIYNEIANNSEYNSFLNAYDRFVTFVNDATESEKYGYSVSVRYHQELAPIGLEWTTGKDIPAANDYADLKSLASQAYTMFVPDNDAMQSFYNKYWKDYYPNLESVNFIPVLTLLQNHIYRGSMLFPTQIESGKFLTDLGTTIQMDRNDPKMKKVCVNGAVYGLGEVYTPPLFERVTAPMYCDPKYSYFLEMMYGSNKYTESSSRTLERLISNNIQYKIFYPSNDMIINNTSYQGGAISYKINNTNKFGGQVLQVEGSDGIGDMSNQIKHTIAMAHVATELAVQKGDESIYKTLNSYNYIYMKGDKVYTSASYNSTEGGTIPSSSVPTVKKYTQTWSNGEAYELEGDEASALLPEFSQFKNVIIRATSSLPASWFWFKRLVDASGMAVSAPPFSFLQTERYIVLIPESSALQTAIYANKVPLSPASAVNDYLKNYFIRVNASNLLDYPFAGTGVNAQLVSFGVNSAGKTVTYKLTDDGTDLYVEDAKGNKVKVLSFFPNIYDDCAVYIIEGILEIE